MWVPLASARLTDDSSHKALTSSLGQRCANEGLSIPVGWEFSPSSLGSGFESPCGKLASQLWQGSSPLWALLHPVPRTRRTECSDAVEGPECLGFSCRPTINSPSLPFGSQRHYYAESHFTVDQKLACFCAVCLPGLEPSPFWEPLLP